MTENLGAGPVAAADRPTAEGGAISLRGLVRRFDDVVAVDGLDLEIAAGEFFSLLGESGCGKTTTLRMIAGFEQPDEGEILLDGTDLTAVPAHKRPVNTVFQSYALFPFLSVWDNVGFGLKYAGSSGRGGAAEARTRIGEALDLVELGGLAKRKPHQLSGGQQQRVALARALVLGPRVLLLDEPLGALDARLRKTLQRELRALQRRVRTTFVYVTHDQDEAMTMSDRLAVVVNGRIAQVGAPADVYAAPATEYVAGFLGHANLWPGTVVGSDSGGTRCRVGEQTLTVARTAGDSAGAAETDVRVMIRPERVRLAADSGPSERAAQGGSGNRLAGTVTELTFHGARTHALVECPALGSGIRVDAELPNDAGALPEWLRPGGPVSVELAADALRLLPVTAR